ncbi:MAG TPA: 6-pyruvoyl tetrahydrobiopterin synthase [Cryomorphaceae bacterium]|jgi:6-pyruvoyltetrahydropterin/6-carboxytetrahydropterin synthase|nr:MAG: 6-pyruvoyl tetrahydrobiopterin synthase [Cryomorphaceae bacterium BACL7 MAG-120910-bin2]KRO69282.1 MAG: 6-pyruvoyl tetrahydrobiopterin synthase [Cryomorphaceae bacterium BACL7 MAG-120322-bin74]KRO82365.1 MAG: 6-pyruvoyl tetrahydrobiopterin synthase [Cryomorphaceae bacterium BACL7 MAG-121220-bin83]NQW25159.1 6-carboxytetrahydropterin synthase [Cryomorphaceae bacterium]HAB31049.1 6-pyruvoyl tetrahydrobiopterin synthase [Cryomorphaceae bacterium]
MKATISRHAHFNAAHRLHVSHWTEERNASFFGACNNPLFHGHNYELIVGITGEIDPETGYVYDMKQLADLIKAEVEGRLDHKNLNLEVEEFAQLNPTAENIAAVIYSWLRPHIEAEYEIKVTLYETPRNYVEYNG